MNKSVRMMKILKNLKRLEKFLKRVFKAILFTSLTAICVIGMTYTIIFFYENAPIGFTVISITLVFVWWFLFFDEEIKRDNK